LGPARQGARAQCVALRLLARERARACGGALPPKQNFHANGSSKLVECPHHVPARVERRGFYLPAPGRCSALTVALDAVKPAAVHAQGRPLDRGSCRQQRRRHHTHNITAWPGLRRCPAQALQHALHLGFCRREAAKVHQLQLWWWRCRRQSAVAPLPRRRGKHTVAQQRARRLLSQCPAPCAPPLGLGSKPASPVLWICTHTHARHAHLGCVRQKAQSKSCFSSGDGVGLRSRFRWDRGVNGLTKV
jgi:hypothetical protein